jgi:SAM-dependent methyltransferase
MSVGWAVVGCARAERIVAPVARRYDFRNDLFTHQPVLFAVAERCTGPIAECGCGFGSTLFLHEIAERRGVKVVSLDSDPNWFARFNHLASPNHEFRYVESWTREMQRPEWDRHWGLVLVDQTDWGDRVLTVERVRSSADYVILHDSSASPAHGLGQTIRPVNGPRDLGKRDYQDAFSSWREFFPPDPWPNVDGPPTLLASNRFDVNAVEVNYLKHTPYWWRVGRHLRRVVPQPVRMRIANRIGWRIRPGFSSNSAG